MGIDRVQRPDAGDDDRFGVSDGEGSLWKVRNGYGELNADGTDNAAKNTGNIAKQTISLNVSLET